MNETSTALPPANPPRPAHRSLFGLLTNVPYRDPRLDQVSGS
jgi:hypothetical protein